ncbi:NUDIX hydrolase [Candidatus Woesearchaeota archaeon]|nr:NUDIX hydrolase [Candidatus Woesearchaeota archaeon]
MIREVFNGKQFKIIQEDVVDELGVSHIVEKCIRPDVVTVLLKRDDSVLLLREFRPEYKKNVFWLPGGKIDSGEEPVLCAQRELEEETGYVVPTSMFSLFHKKSPSDVSRDGFVFLADISNSDIKDVGDKGPEKGDLVWFPLDNASSLLSQSEPFFMSNELFIFLILKLASS